jgi:hypothetical protein
MTTAGVDPVERLAEAQAVRAMILGTLIGATIRPDYPIKIRDREEWFDEEDIVQAVSLTTGSGLRFKVTVEYEGEEPS